MSLLDKIWHLGPCSRAAAWLAKQKTPAQAWRDCQHADWMLWLIDHAQQFERGDADHRRLIACALACLDDYFKQYPPPKKVMNLLKKFASGASTPTHRTIENAKEACAGIGVSAARSLLRDVDDPRHMDAWWALWVAEYQDGRADIVRKFYPKPPVIKKRKA